MIVIRFYYFYGCWFSLMVASFCLVMDDVVSLLFHIILSPEIQEDVTIAEVRTEINIFVFNSNYLRLEERKTKWRRHWSTKRRSFPSRSWAPCLRNRWSSPWSRPTRGRPRNSKNRRYSCRQRPPRPSPPSTRNSCWISGPRNRCTASLLAPATKYGTSERIMI